MLSLYNAVNGTAYSDAGGLEITTISDSVYMGMKNDVSFLLHSTMNFWEQQSTFNPNMPIRQLMYAGRVYDKYIHQHRLNIYGKSVIRLPLPKLVVFYNGQDERADETVLELKDAFPPELKDAEPDISVRVRMLNINKGRNTAILAACRPLSEYSWLVQGIRDRVAGDMEIEEAVDATIDEMPEGFLVRNFLIGNRAEVKNMCITEYNEAETMQMFKEEGRKEGKREGRKEGKKEGEDKLARLIKALVSADRLGDVTKAADDTSARDSFYEEFGIV